MSEIERIQERLQRFADERAWGEYHTPKNLAMALAGEAGELLAEFQWLTPDESFDVMGDDVSGAAVRGELADVAIYMLRLADVLGVDLAAVVDAKMDVNEQRFPQSVGSHALRDDQILDLWVRIWDSATDETDSRGWRKHTAGIKWLLEKYGVDVRVGAGPHGAVRQDALRRLESLGAIERIGGGQQAQTRSLWVAPVTTKA